MIVEKKKTNRKTGASSTTTKKTTPITKSQFNSSRVAKSSLTTIKDRYPEKKKSELSPIKDRYSKVNKNSLSSIRDKSSTGANKDMLKSIKSNRNISKTSTAPVTRKKLDTLIARKK